MRGVFYSFLAKESQYVVEEYMNDGLNRSNRSPTLPRGVAYLGARFGPHGMSSSPWPYDHQSAGIVYTKYLYASRNATQHRYAVYFGEPSSGEL